MRNFIGIVAGAVGLSLVTLGFHALFFRPVLGDGQYGMVWLFTIPAGAILGGATAFALAAHRQHPVQAGRAGLMASVAVALPLGLYLLMTVTNSQAVSSVATRSTPGAVLVEGLLFALPTVLWLAAAFLAGVLLVGRKVG
jgi:hypothetical protein